MVDLVRQQIPLIVWAGLLLGVYVALMVRGAFRR